jgi:hypothetical protein
VRIGGALFHEAVSGVYRGASVLELRSPALPSALGANGQSGVCRDLLSSRTVKPPGFQSRIWVYVRRASDTLRQTVSDGFEHPVSLAAAPLDHASFGEVSYPLTVLPCLSASFAARFPTITEGI